MKKCVKLIFVTLSCAFWFTVKTAHAQGTAFTYQGRLNNNNAPVTGIYNFTFTLTNSAGGAVVAGPVTNTGVPVTNGLFTTLINFGPGVFTGNSNLLQIGVATNGSSDFTTLSPSQPVTPTPYAIFAENVSGLMLQPNSSGAPNVIEGSSVNYISNGVVGGTISGGGATNYAGTGLTNSVTGNFGTVGGGADNAASGIYSTVNGGAYNGAGNEGATVSGGETNTAGGYLSTVGGGSENAAGGQFATVSGGSENTARGLYATVGGGGDNTSGGVNATVSGGDNNFAIATNATVGGGQSDIASASFSTVSGGQQNTASNIYSTVSGGFDNVSGNAYSTISGGNENISGGPFSTVSGGTENTASGLGATVSGGQENTSGSQNATVSGGFANIANGQYATVSGGSVNTANGQYATIGGGSDNTANGTSSFVAGQNSTDVSNNIPCDHAFVWGDGSRQAVAQGANSFNALATGGVWFFTGASPAGVKLTPGSSAWATLSDRNQKKNLHPVNYKSLLDKLAAVPIQEWNYKWEKDSDVPNLGPMAQDFKKAFYPGRDDKSITTLEFDGVELAAIQGLNQKIDEQKSSLQTKDEKMQMLATQLEKESGEIEQLRQTIDELKKLVLSSGKKAD